LTVHGMRMRRSTLKATINIEERRPLSFLRLTHFGKWRRARLRRSQGAVLVMAVFEREVHLVQTVVLLSITISRTRLQSPRWLRQRGLLDASRWWPSLGFFAREASLAVVFGAALATDAHLVAQKTISAMFFTIMSHAFATTFKTRLFAHPREVRPGGGLWLCELRVT